MQGMDDDADRFRADCFSDGFFEKTLPTIADPDPVDRAEDDRFSFSRDDDSAAGERCLDSFGGIISQWTPNGRRGIHIENSDLYGGLFVGT